MFLEIKGIGKVLDSRIELKGITIIAGENNSGKSTFGKVLYCMFNAFYNADSKIHNARIAEIKRIFRNGLPRFQNGFLRKSTIEDILLNRAVQEVVGDVIQAYSLMNQPPDNAMVGALLENLNRSIAIDNHEIHGMIITDFFRQEFSGQVNHINNPYALGGVSLEIKGKNIDVSMQGNECINFKDDVGLLHEAIYIDTPFVMDDIKQVFSEVFAGSYHMLKHRDDL
ncbi:MAG: ATP-binding protein, partial [Spirochaetaceae bacterium]|nr:ATP-binding protein [Spirochaetaceae bacterium]